MRKIRTTLLAIAVGCAAAPLAFAQSNTTPYGSSVNNNSNMGSSSTSRMDKSCAGLTGTALSRCEADARKDSTTRNSANADSPGKSKAGQSNVNSGESGTDSAGASGAGVGAGAGVGTGAGAGGAGTGGAGTGTR